MKRFKQAFTLMEVLLVSGLVAILAIAIFRSFGNGLRLWGKAERLTREAEISIFLDKMAEDLRSTVVTSGLMFNGTSMQVAFPAIVLTKADAKSTRAWEGMVDQIGAVQYRFDPGERRILRRQANYSQALKGRWEENEVPVALGIDELILRYEVASDKSFLLKSELRDNLPSGVMVEVRFTDDNGPHELKRYLPIPIGG